MARCQRGKTFGDGSRCPRLPEGKHDLCSDCIDELVTKAMGEAQAGMKKGAEDPHPRRKALVTSFLVAIVTQLGTNTVDHWDKIVEVARQAAVQVIEPPRNFQPNPPVRISNFLRGPRILLIVPMPPRGTKVVVKPEELEKRALDWVRALDS
jgi:hypothetical protein